jgi:uncharacterized protein YuzE
LKISYDPAADAIYVTLRTITEADSGPTNVDESGVIVDTDRFGRPRGFEFLSVRFLGVPIATLPEEVAGNLERFIADGYLNSEQPVEVEY